MDNIRKFWGLMVQKKGKKLFRDEIVWELMVQKKVKKKKEKRKINFFLFRDKIYNIKNIQGLMGQKKSFKKKKKKNIYIVIIKIKLHLKIKNKNLKKICSEYFFK